MKPRRVIPGGVSCVQGPVLHGRAAGRDHSNDDEWVVRLAWSRSRRLILGHSEFSSASVVLLLTVDDLITQLSQQFGFSAFRPGQREVIEAVLSRRDALAVMPTGQGKSLCYQLPATLLPGLTLVISPLIASDARSGQQHAGEEDRGGGISLRPFRV